MNVNSYIYKSPSPQAVQVGRLDTSTKSQDLSGDNSGLSTNESFNDAQNFQSTQVNEVKPKVDTENTLDIYA